MTIRQCQDFQVVVMDEGEIVQIGTPVELFSRPAHTFVGHFIGSPGMNVLPCEMRDKGAFFEGNSLPLEGKVRQGLSGRTEIGIRPEFVSIGKKGLEATVVKVSDVGRHSVVQAMVGDTRLSAIIDDDIPNQGDVVKLAFQQDQTRLYCDGWLASEI